MGAGRRVRFFWSGVGQRTVSLLMLLVLSHGFEACGTGKQLVREAGLVIRLGAILSVDVLVSLGSVVCGLCEVRTGMQ